MIRWFRCFCFALAALSTTSAVGSLLEDGITSCGQQKIALERLACYDNLYRRIAEQQSMPNNDKWTTTTTPSLMLDKNNVLLELDAAYPIKSRTQTVTPRLALACKDAVTTVSIHWGIYLGKNRTRLLIRMENEPEETSNWNIEEKYTVRYKGDAQDLIGKLKESPTLIVKVTPYNADPVIAQFTLNGLAEQIQYQQSTCDW